MRVENKIRSFAEARCEDNEIIRDGLTYGDCREVLKIIEVLRLENEKLRPDKIADRVTPNEMLEAINTCLKLNDEEFELSEWEENFVISIEAKLKNNQTLTPKQIERLESIYERT